MGLTFNLISIHLVELPGTAPGSNWYHDIRLQTQSYFNLIYNATRLKNKPKIPSYVTQKKSHESATSRITASNINITPRPRYVACTTRWLQKITLQLVRKHEPGIGPQLCLQSFLHLKIYVTRIIGLQNILIRSNCRKLYQPHISVHIIP